MALAIVRATMKKAANRSDFLKLILFERIP